MSLADIAYMCGPPGHVYKLVLQYEQERGQNDIRRYSGLYNHTIERHLYFSNNNGIPICYQINPSLSLLSFLMLDMVVGRFPVWIVVIQVRICA